MHYRGVVPALMLAAALGLAGCSDQQLPQTATVTGDPNNTSVLGGYGSGNSRNAAAPALTDAQGQRIPPPPVPAQTQAQALRSGDDTALAVWVQDNHVLASTWTRGGGWSPPQALERIYGRSSDPQLASNGRGTAMAVWRHTVGNIQSLRFSRFEQATGWSHPDVMPGALPRPDAGNAPVDRDAPRLQMDTQGNVIAQWSSGFAANEVQVARYIEGRGWSKAASEPVAAAPTESPAR